MLVEVKAMVPEERVGEFYGMLGQWLQGAAPLAQVPGQRSEWGPEDGPLAARVREGLPANGGRLLDLLLAEGELDTESIAAQIGLSDGSQVTGVAGWVGRIANTVGRLSPIKTTQTGGGTLWRLDPDVADLFRQPTEVRKEV